MNKEERKCYERGVADAIEKAIEWIRFNEEEGGCVFDGWEDDFKKEITQSLPALINCVIALITR